MDGFLEQAFAQSQRRLAAWKKAGFLESLRRQRPGRPRPVPFSAALVGNVRPRLIAEIKRSSPSGGTLAKGVDVPARARQYVQGGAAAISIVTESHWFGGSLEDLVAARNGVPIPILRKDFIVDEYDLEVTAAAGADAVLLIADCFDSDRLRDLIQFAGSLGLEALVEIHDADQAGSACRAGARIIGVNSRNLHTLDVDLPGALRVVRSLSADRVKVLESGITSPGQVRAALDAGASAVLVGEALMRAADPAQVIRRLFSTGGIELEGAAPSCMRIDCP